MVSILESRYGHVLERLVPVWGNPAGVEALFMDLMFDARGTRAGWPADIWEELQFLHALHKLAYATPQVEDEPMDDRIKWV